MNYHVGIWVIQMIPCAIKILTKIALQTHQVPVAVILIELKHYYFKENHQLILCHLYRKIALVMVSFFRYTVMPVNASCCRFID